VPRHKLTTFERSLRQIIAQNLKKVSQGMTQNDLAAKTGIPTSTLSGYFAQRSTPSPGNVQRIADALDCNKSAIDPRFNDAFLHSDACFQAVFIQLSSARQATVLKFAQAQLTEQNTQRH